MFGDAFWVYMGWRWAEFVLSMSVAILFGTCLLIGLAIKRWRQSRCRHLRTFEDRACNEICTDCHKNFGFVGRPDRQKDFDGERVRPWRT